MSQERAAVDWLSHGIEPISDIWREQALRRLDSLTKPLGSLGRLEEIAAQWVAIREERWQEPIRKGAYLFAADHGVVIEGVSAYPSEVTRQMVLNFLAGGAAVNVLVRLHGVDLAVIDIGVAGRFEATAGLLDRKIAGGTRNLRREAAMSEDELDRALAVGAEMADAARAAGQNLVAIGEMGIGNTTAASAITCALTGVSASIATGRGAGLSKEAHGRKVAVVEAAVAMHFGGGATPTPWQILCRVGGFEIAAMTGMFLRAASHRLVVVLDGFISTAAAALAVALTPETQGYLIAGHRSEEPGHGVLLQHLNLRPLLTLEMRLGEGSGAMLAIPIIESAVALYGEMATFDSARVSEART